MPGIVIPDNSYYAAIAKNVQDLGDERLGKYAISAEACANKVVDGVEKGATGKAWFGGGASAMGWAASLLPDWLMDQSVTALVPWVTKIQR
ncbi:hypothetical protein ONS95_012138 [Cadophora gregata]|uniref:uncharacterized protein n=1 Tax=Cadophora gregata TaxID=51156 RepID=UPI0026DC649A|nr:uncharacterized protein ONS95_012138 [Cadophora gregata]KAK0117813.1 hypothetical protein ONS95_012138 [Cadophora gregata]